MAYEAMILGLPERIDQIVPSAGWPMRRDPCLLGELLGGVGLWLLATLGAPADGGAVPLVPMASE